MIQNSILQKKVAVVFLIAFIFNAFSQNTDKATQTFKFKNYTIFDGVPSTSVPSIVQDHKGFMWFGTRDGLSRFDGFNFTNFSKDESNPNSLSHNQVQKLFVDSKGTLWIGTKKGLNTYKEGVGFIKYFNNFEDSFSLSGNLVHSITEDHKGQIWVGTSNGINLYNHATNQFTSYTHNPKNTNSLSSNYVKEVYADAHGFLWIITNLGIDRLDIEQKKFTHFSLNQEKKDAREVNFASAILEDKKGRIWIGDNDGLYYFNQYENKFIPYKGQHNVLENLSVRAIEEDNKGNLWIGSYLGLFIDNFEQATTKRIIHNNADPNSLSSNSIHAVCRDNKGDFWLGTWAGGINYLDKSLDNFNYYGVANGLSNPVVSSFAEDAKNNLWIGTEGGGINYFDRSNNSFTSYKHDSENKNSLSANNVHDLVKDKNGNLYVATFGGGLDFVDLSSGKPKFTNYNNKPEDAESIHSNYIISMCKDFEENIWMGTSSEGVCKFNPETKKFTSYSEGDYALGQVATVFENRKKEIIVGSNNGLGVVDQQKGMINYKPFRIVNNAIDEYVVSIFQDSKENYWLGTEGDGLVFLSADLKSIKKYQKNDGLPNNVVYGIIPDNLGNLWLSTHSGISKFNIVAQTFQNYNVHDGLQSNEFNFDAYAVSKKGELIFGGINGFNIFYPSKIKDISTTSSVVLTDFKINEEHVKVAAEKSPLSKPLAQTKEITLSADQSIFSFEFIALNYAQPGKNEYAYKLEGFNNKWLNIGNRRQVTFTNMHAGDYVFKVKSLNKNNTGEELVTSVNIKILPPAYLTWWAYCFYALFFILAGLVIRKNIRLRIKDKNQLKKEKLEREKNDELYQLKMQFFTNISHELRTPLTLITGPVENLISEKDAFTEKQQRELGLIQKNAKSLLRQVNRILDFRKDESGKLKLKAAKGNFLKFAKETSLSFQQIAEARNINYAFECEYDEIKLYFDRDKMEMVIYNLLSNAFKFTKDGGSIRVKVEKEKVNNKKYVKISVKDDGRGIDKNNLEHVFERFYQVGNVIDEAKGSGIGLAFTKRLVELHYGEINATSEIEKGTEFTVKIPTGKEHFKESELFKKFKSGEDVTSYKAENEEKETAQHPELENIVRKENEKLPILLIVEDNDDVRTFIKGCFEGEFNIHEAENGAIGCELARKIIPDIILSDVMMPEKDGIALCSELKKDIVTSHIPIVLLTARTSLIFKKNGLETGADDYINKPFTPNILKLKVKNILESRKKIQEYFIRNYRIKPKEVVLTSKDDLFLDKAIKCVEEHLSDSEFNVSVFVEDMAMSRSVLFRKLKGITGQSTTEFIRTIRIKRAGQMLLQNQMSISEVAYDVGFNDLKYFRTCFRKQFHTSPSKYIAENKAKAVAISEEN